MLEGLDKVDWGALYNRRSQISPNTPHTQSIPILLQDLFDGVANEDDLGILLNLCAINEVLVDDITIITLPYVLQLLLLDTFTDKLYILYFLSSILLDISSRNYIGKRIYKIIYEHEYIFTQLFKHPQLPIRLKALEVWRDTVLPYDEFFPMVMQVVKDETNHRLRVYLLKYVSAYGVCIWSITQEKQPELSSELVSILQQEYDQTQSKYLRLLLACSLMRLLGDDAPLDVVKDIVDSVTLEHLYECDDLTIDPHIQQHYLRTDHKLNLLYRCNRGIARPAFFHILKYDRELIDWDDETRLYGMYYQGTGYIYTTNFRLYVAVLDHLFWKSYFIPNRNNKLELIKNSKQIKPPTTYWEKRYIPKVKRLGKVQFEFLIWLINDDRFWEHDHNLLVWYGLPATREKLRKFVEKASNE